MYPPTEMAEKDGIRKKWLEATNAQFGIIKHYPPGLKVSQGPSLTVGTTG